MFISSYGSAELATTIKTELEIEMPKDTFEIIHDSELYGDVPYAIHIADRETTYSANFSLAWRFVDGIQVGMRIANKNNRKKVLTS